MILQNRNVYVIMTKADNLIYVGRSPRDRFEPLGKIKSNTAIRVFPNTFEAEVQINNYFQSRQLLKSLGNEGKCYAREDLKIVKVVKTLTL